MNFNEKKNCGVQAVEAENPHKVLVAGSIPAPAIFNMLIELENLCKL